MPAILPQSQWDKISVRVLSSETQHIYIRLSVYIKQGGGGGGGAVTMTTPRHHRLLSQRHGATSDHIVVTPTALPRSVQYIGVAVASQKAYFQRPLVPTWINFNLNMDK